MYLIYVVLVNGKCAGRENDHERILAYNIGVSIHDVNYAMHIYNMLSKDKDVFDHLGNAEMEDPKEKFWI